MAISLFATRVQYFVEQTKRISGKGEKMKRLFIVVTPDFLRPSLILLNKFPSDPAPSQSSHGFYLRSSGRSTMPKEKRLRTLLPAEEKHTTQPLEAGTVKEIRRNISIACTECQRKKTMVKLPKALSQA